MAIAQDEECQPKDTESVSRQQEHGIPQLQLRRLRDPPVLDGNINESAWENAAWIDRFVQMDGSGEIRNPTEVRLGYDDQALYLAFVCHDDQADRLQTLETQRDGTVYKDDCVEVFLDPAGTRQQFKHFIVNVAGVQYDDDSGDSSWNATWDAVPRRYADRWTVEFRIPFASLGLGNLFALPLVKGSGNGVQPNWIANFNRNNPKSGELTGWSPTFGGFRSPGRFGELAGLDVDFSRFAMCGCWKDRPEPWRRGENRVEMEIENRTEREITGIMSLTQLGREGGPLAVTTLTLPPGERKVAALTASLEETGEAWLAAQFVSVAGPAWNAPPLGVTIPELLETVLLQPAYRASFFASRPEREAVVQAMVSGLQVTDGQAKLWAQVERVGQAGELIGTQRNLGEEVDLTGDGVYELRFDFAGEPPGKYRIAVELANRAGIAMAGTEHELRILPPSDFEVTFDQNRVCLLNGEPFFPIGLYQVCQAAIDTIEKENLTLGIPARTVREHLQDIKDHGFNCVVHSWGFPDEEFRDLLAEAELYWSPEIGRMGSGSLRHLVEEHKSDPYLLWWYGIDEPAGEGLDKAIQDRDMFEEVDPYRPVAAAICHPGIFGRFVEAFDILMPDAYGILVVANWTDGCIQAGQGRVPVWVVPQGFGMEPSDVPTPEKLRCEAFLALTHGATGLIWFTYAHPFEGFEGAQGYRDGWWYLPETPLWAEFAQLNQEIADLTPVLVSPPIEASVTASDEAIHVLLKEYGGKYYLFAVNDSPASVACQFTELVPNGNVEVLFGGSTITPNSEGWADQFEGYATRVYRF